MHLGQSSTQNSTQQESACAPLGAGCSTRHGRCSDPPRSHHETRSCTAYRPDVTYGQVSLSVASPRSAVLSRPCQHRQRLATLCNTAPVYALPQFLETQPPLSAPATTGNTGQRGRGNRQGIPHHVRTNSVFSTSGCPSPRPLPCSAKLSHHIIRALKLLDDKTILNTKRY